LLGLLTDEHHDSRPKDGCRDADKYGVETFSFCRFVCVHSIRSFGVGLVKAEKQDVGTLDFDHFAVIRAQEMSEAIGAYGVTYERVNVVNELEQGVVAGFARVAS
jgi:hypothetical protein